MTDQPHSPALSIILPTYNRARFLPQAFGAIRGQQFTDWELIVVDDGSTDNTQELVAELTRGWEQSVQYVHQENQGAYGARNTGLGLARGKYIAFYDSDDLWLPHHLQDCVAALDVNRNVDWVYGACRIVDHSTGAVLAPSTFYVDGRPRPFMRLRARSEGQLRIIEEPRAARLVMRGSGLFSGLQNSVIRRQVFGGQRFHVSPRNESEDQVFVVRSLLAGHCFGYLDNVHVVYHIHGQNSSAAGSTVDLERRLRVIRELIAGYENLRSQVRLSAAENRALNRRLSRAYFWLLGYGLWQSPEYRDEALQMYRHAIRLWPWDPGFWKTYSLALVKLAVARRKPATLQED